MKIILNITVEPSHLTNMKSINWSIAFEKAFVVYVHWIVIAAIYFIANFSFTYCRRKSDFPATFRNLALALFICLSITTALSWYIGEKLGTHTEGEDDDTYTVRDYEPTKEQLWTERTRLFLMVLPAGVAGILTAYQSDRKLTATERQKQNSELNRPPRDSW